MENSRARKSGQDNLPWYDVIGLIAGINATAAQKFFLTLVFRHTHSRKGFAWMAQEEIAREMNVNVRTVERLFAWGKKLRVVNVRPIRTGPQEQHNEYWLNLDRLKELRRAPSDPTLMAGQESEDPTPMSGGMGEHDPTPTSPMTRQIRLDNPTNPTIRPDTGVGEGFEVKQVVSTSGKERHRQSIDDDKLRKWAKAQILKNASGPVRDEAAYVGKSLPAFFANLDFQVEAYLTLQAKIYIGSALWSTPDSPFGWLELANLLDYLCEQDDLPIPDDPAVLDRILAAVQQIQGDNILVHEPFGFVASQKWRTFRHNQSEPVTGWHHHRTAMAGYVPSRPGFGIHLFNRTHKAA